MWGVWNLFFTFLKTLFQGCCFVVGGGSGGGDDVCVLDLLRPAHGFNFVFFCPHYSYLPIKLRYLKTFCG